MLAAYSILLVEDDEVDVMSIDRAFQKANISNVLFKATNGVEALEMLDKGIVQKPLIILLDLNMPKMGGLELLKILKQHDKYKSIPVIVLTSSINDEDITKAYRTQVAGYMTKPIGMEQLIEKMSALGRYWTLCEISINGHAH